MTSLGPHLPSTLRLATGSIVVTALRSTLHLAAASTIVATLSSLASAGSIDESLALDIRLLPAIERLRAEVSAGSAASASPPSTQARRAVAAVCERWREHRQALQISLAPDPLAPTAIARAGRHLGRACSSAEAGRAADALRLLELVRDEFAASRERTGQNYFLDRVIDYERARATLLRTHATDAAAGTGRDRTERAFIESMARWREIERMLPELTGYPLREGALRSLQDAADRHDRALATLSAALDIHATKPAALADAVRALSRPFDDPTSYFAPSPQRLRGHPAEPKPR